MKRCTAILLCAALLIGSFSCFGAAVKADGDRNDYPVILVAGYSSSSLYLGDDPETGEHVWGVDMDEILQKVLTNIAEVGRGLGALAFRQPKMIADTVGVGAVELYGDLAMNPDGTSVNNIHHYSNDPALINSANIQKTYPDGDILRHETEIEKEIAESIGYENIYHFQCDFRLGQLVCAKELDDCVEGVLAYTGKQKVNLFAVSHGGQTVSTYLTLYGQKNRVHNAVLTVPAIGGAALAYDPMADSVKLDEECLIRFIEHGTQTEENYDWLVKAQQLGILDDVIHYLVPHLLEIIGYWGSIWDFLPAESYEAVKKLRLDPKESAPLIRESDKYRYQVQPKVPQALRDCQARGVNISILAGSGNPIVSGTQMNSDAIITVKSSTGATCAPWGTRFADGYKQINACGGKYKVSPSMEIDASTCYLPDNTWFVNGLFHGMTLWDPYTCTLMVTQLVTDRLQDVYSDPAFPQFHDTTNPSQKVYCAFSGAAPGYVTGESDTLTVTNVSQKSRVRLTGISVQGADLRIPVNPLKILAPGESVTLKVKGKLPEVSRQAMTVTVCYTFNNVTPVNYRTQGFTICNGDAPAYEAESYRGNTAPALLAARIGQPAAALLAKLGLAELMTLVFSWLDARLSLLKIR